MVGLKICLVLVTSQVQQDWKACQMGKFGLASERQGYQKQVNKWASGSCVGTSKILKLII